MSTLTVLRGTAPADEKVRVTVTSDKIVVKATALTSDQDLARLISGLSAHKERVKVNAA